MSDEIYIAKQETLLEMKTKVETVQNTLVETETKVGAVQNKLSETETKVEAVQNTLGKTNDSGGTPTTGTVVAKENAILTEVNKIGNTADTGATATAGTIMGKLNALSDFNWKHHVVQKVKGSVTTTLPAPVVSGTQETVSFGVEFDTPVSLNYIRINISSVVGGYDDRSYVLGSIKLTFYDGTTMVFGLNSSQGYSSYIYIGIFNQIFQVGGSPDFSSKSYGSDRIPRHDLCIKKVEAVNWYHKNNITSPPTTGTCKANIYVYYKEITKIRG